MKKTFSIRLGIVLLVNATCFLGSVSFAQRETRTQQLKLDDGAAPPKTIIIATPVSGTTNWTLTLPPAPPTTPGNVLTADLAGVTSWVPSAFNTAQAWGTFGNTGTNPALGYFIGTTDNMAFEIHVNESLFNTTPTSGAGRVMRFEPHTTSPNILGGYNGNTIASGAQGVTISGGGQSGAINTVSSTTSMFATIGGGQGNTISGGNNGTIPGGYKNIVSADNATAGGSQSTASGINATAFGFKAVAAGLTSVALGSEVNASAANSFAIGQWVTASAANAIVIGSGLSAASQLNNNVTNSLMVGFGSNLSTLFVGPYGTQVDNRGYVGIGTTTPSARLEIHGEDNLITHAALNVTDNSGTSALYITDNRKVGIGGFSAVDTPAARLHIRGLTDGTTTSPPTLALDIVNANNAPLLKVYDDGRMLIGTNNRSFSGLTSNGDIGPVSDNTSSLGGCSLQWRDIYIGRNILLNCNSVTGFSRGQISYNTAAQYLEFFVGDGTANPTTAMVVSENNRRVGITDNSVGVTAFSTTAPQGQLDVRSTTGALIVPRMTQAQKVALTGVNGSIIYQTDSPVAFPAEPEGFYFYDNAAWVKK